MSNKYFLFISIATIFFFSSCNNAVKEKQIAKIDSLMAIIDTARINLNKINKDTVGKRFLTYQETNKLVAEHYKEYRNEENWKYVCSFQEVRKPFKTMIFNYNSYKSDLDSSRKQLENLKHDVEKKLITEKEFENFFKIESKSANELTFKINIQVERVIGQLKNFDTVHPYMLKLIETYPKNKKDK
jgi:hypothetical protein